MHTFFGNLAGLGVEEILLGSAPSSYAHLFWQFGQLRGGGNFYGKCSFVLCTHFLASWPVVLSDQVVINYYFNNNINQWLLKCTEAWAASAERYVKQILVCKNGLEWPHYFY